MTQARAAGDWPGASGAAACARAKARHRAAPGRSARKHGPKESPIASWPPKRRELAAGAGRSGRPTWSRWRGLLDRADEVVPMGEVLRPSRRLARALPAPCATTWITTIENAVRLAEWEAGRGYRATYYVLHGDWYWGGPIGPRLLRRSSCGPSIGSPRSVTRSASTTTRSPSPCSPARTLIGSSSATSAALRRHGFQVDGSVAHGDPLCRKVGYLNSEIFTGVPAVRRQARRSPDQDDRIRRPEPPTQLPARLRPADGRLRPDATRRTRSARRSTCPIPAGAGARRSRRSKAASPRTAASSRCSSIRSGGRPRARSSGRGRRSGQRPRPDRGPGQAWRPPAPRFRRSRPRPRRIRCGALDRCPWAAADATVGRAARRRRRGASQRCAPICT